MLRKICLLLNLRLRFLNIAPGYHPIRPADTKVKSVLANQKARFDNVGFDFDNWGTYSVSPTQHTNNSFLKQYLSVLTWKKICFR